MLTPLNFIAVTFNVEVAMLAISMMASD